VGGCAEFVGGCAEFVGGCAEFVGGCASLAAIGFGCSSTEFVDDRCSEFARERAAI
jgi:hypothetical protein